MNPLKTGQCQGQGHMVAIEKRLHLHLLKIRLDGSHMYTFKEHFWQNPRRLAEPSIFNNWHKTGPCSSQSPRTFEKRQKPLTQFVSSLSRTATYLDACFPHSSWTMLVPRLELFRITCAFMNK